MLNSVLNCHLNYLIHLIRFSLNIKLEHNLTCKKVQHYG